jgi:hypothetical protein
MANPIAWATLSPSSLTEYPTPPGPAEYCTDRDQSSRVRRAGVRRGVPNVRCVGPDVQAVRLAAVVELGEVAQGTEEPKSRYFAWSRRPALAARRGRVQRGACAGRRPHRCSCRSGRRGPLWSSLPEVGGSGVRCWLRCLGVEAPESSAKLRRAPRIDRRGESR